jgi:hypothetical protein
MKDMRASLEGVLRGEEDRRPDERLIEVAHGSEKSRQVAWAKYYELEMEIKKLEARLELADLERQRVQQDADDFKMALRWYAQALWNERHDQPRASLEDLTRTVRWCVRVAWMEQRHR